MPELPLRMPLSLLFFQAAFIDNYLWAKFLGMCTCLSCSDSIKKANALGLSVITIMTVSNSLNWFLYTYFIKLGALSWLPLEGSSTVDLSHMTFLVLLSLTCGSVQVLSLLLDTFLQELSASIGVYLKLLAVNCAILAACTTSLQEGYSFPEHLVYQVGAGVGWWLAILLLAGLRKRIRISALPPCAEGAPITFIIMGLLSMAFAGLAGLDLSS
ncbi:Rnf-Nqr domain containing protein [Candidatus Similichlamydia laticola]|uniref:Na(+)-translocating NADH-quinone reductase subunit E n=1 Tax=Candidatus Similichlamydia laticola TaxID=2170265 RepID=A0A369KCP0_9BACT|nr:Rnf-Nqr domain containing protein [Candidatus Similichlamydia laticola]RDB31362.1 Na(+)-translocating NADH-quinone reductase subunit E [Candidatus Similichlamydia laticola]